MRDGAETQQVQPVSSDGQVALNLPQLDAELGSHEHGFYEKQRTDPVYLACPVAAVVSAKVSRPNAHLLIQHISFVPL